jgi:hypothetical protein
VPRRKRDRSGLTSTAPLLAQTQGRRATSVPACDVGSAHWHEPTRHADATPHFFAAVNWLVVGVPVVEFRRRWLLVEGVGVGLLVADSVEVLAVDVGERCAVAGVAEEEVEHGPDEGEAAILAGEAAHHLGAPADLAERSFEEVR